MFSGVALLAAVAVLVAHLVPGLGWEASSVSASLGIAAYDPLALAFWTVSAILMLLAAVLALPQVRH